MGSKRTAHLRHTGMGANLSAETILDWHTSCCLFVDPPLRQSFVGTFDLHGFVSVISSAGVRSGAGTR
jgi:hypothetical protein